MEGEIVVDIHRILVKVYMLDVRSVSRWNSKGIDNHNEKGETVLMDRPRSGKSALFANGDKTKRTDAVITTDRGIIIPKVCESLQVSLQISTVSWLLKCLWKVCSQNADTP